MLTRGAVNMPVEALVEDVRSSSERNIGTAFIGRCNLATPTATMVDINDETLDVLKICANSSANRIATLQIDEVHESRGIVLLRLFTLIARDCLFE